MLFLKCLTSAFSSSSLISVSLSGSWFAFGSFSHFTFSFPSLSQTKLNSLPTLAVCPNSISLTYLKLVISASLIFWSFFFASLQATLLWCCLTFGVQAQKNYWTEERSHISHTGKKRETSQDSCGKRRTDREDLQVRLQSFLVSAVTVLVHLLLSIGL